LSHQVGIVLDREWMIVVTPSQYCSRLKEWMIVVTPSQ
jgi:hypothetical protein